jgi:NhaP-type Na+/H+ or K+/H+ antiporter
LELLGIVDLEVFVAQLEIRLTLIGMLVGLSLSLTASSFIKSAVSFDYQFFFNLLLPPIILNSGYELHQV